MAKIIAAASEGLLRDVLKVRLPDNGKNEVVVVQSLSEVVRHVVSGGFDIIVLNLDPAEMLATLRSLKRVQAPELPVIVFNTGPISPQLAALGVEHIAKTGKKTSLGELIDKINELTQKS